MNINFAKIVDEVKELDSESKEYLIDLTKKLLIEEKREEIKRHAEESLKEYEKGKIHFGSINDMKKKLYED
jgi:hypothetical protein